MSGSMAVAENEFGLTMKNPIVIVSVLLLILVAIVTAYGVPRNTLDNQGQLGTGGQLPLFMGIISGNIQDMTDIFVIFSVCLGIFSIAEERRGGALNVIISKPLYRRDIILGKFLGLSVVLLTVISFVMVIFISAALLLNPMPDKLLIEIFARTIYLIASLSLYCMVMLGVSMMIGIIFRNIILVFTITATIVYLQGFTSIIGILNILGPISSINVLDPMLLSTYYAWGNNGGPDASNFIFTTSSPFLTWLSSVYPYFLLLVFEAVLVILIDCVLFNREEV